VRPRLRDVLRCPRCRASLTLEPFVVGREDDVVDGLLTCGCGWRYPVVDSIPRMLPDAFSLFPDFVRRYRARLDGAPASTPPERLSADLDRTRESFGYQWTKFSEMVCDFEQNFWNYLAPATPETFRGRLGLDAGCGFGRHIYHAARNGAEMVGMDFSRAIESTRRNTQDLPNVHLVQGDIYAPPFADGTFDLLYSIGVLHHLPDPQRGINTLAPLVRPGGQVFVWLYSKTRTVTNFLLETVRAVTTRLPHPLVNALSFAGAVVDQYGFVLPYRVVRRVPGTGRLAARMLPRIKLYSAYPFQVLQADWFDRLAAPIRFYYSEDEVERFALQAGLTDVKISPTGLYGWRACGVRP
jgi:SAM-dependent methyltransferase/uncharacterized protein YbaR (Trm112 family)